MNKVSIIIVNYNNSNDTIECLKSIENFDNRLEVILVDNGSNKADFEALEGYMSKEIGINVVLLKNSQNLGFAGANNQGIKKAIERGADYVLLLNNDTIVEKDFLKNLLIEAERDNNQSIYSPLIFHYPEKDKIWFVGGRFKGFAEARHIRKIGNSDTDFLSGCCMLVPANIFSRVGFFDEKFFLYYEDVDFCLRARAQGIKLRIVFDSKIYHKVSSVTKKINNQIRMRYEYRNRILVIGKNGSLFSKIFVFPWSVWIIAKQIFKILIGKQTKISKGIIRGVLDGLRLKGGEIKND